MNRSAANESWKLRSPDDVRRFWAKVRDVPRRTKRRTPKQYERYYLGLYLLALADHRLLSYPLKVSERESPDFMLGWESSETTGLEVTRATDEEIQAAMSRAAKKHPEGWALVASPLGYAGNQIEEEFCAVLRKCVEKKAAKFPSFSPAPRYDLLIADDTRAGAGDRHKVVAILTPWARELKQKELKLGRISVVAGLDVLYDIGGDARVFPYIEWSAPKLGSVAVGESFSARVEYAGQVAAEKAIRRDKAAGSPLYFIDSSGRLVKETADGRRFEVRVNEHGDESTIQELSSR